MNYRRLKDLLEEKKITQQELADAINMSRTGVAKMFRDKTMKVEALEKIVKYLGVSMNQFFDDTDGLSIFKEPRQEYDILSKEVIENLRNQVKIKDGQIEFLQHLIEKKEE